MTSFLGCGLPILRNRIYWRLPRPQLAAAGSSLCNDVIPRLRAADPYGIEFAGDYLDHNRQLQGRFSVITSFLGCGLPILRDRICWRSPRPQSAAAGSPLCNDVIPRLRAADPCGIEFAPLTHNRQLQAARFSVSVVILRPQLFFVRNRSRSDRRAAAWGRRRPATRVLQVRFVRDLRRLQPEPGIARLCLSYLI